MELLLFAVLIFYHYGPPLCLFIAGVYCFALPKRATLSRNLSFGVGILSLFTSVMLFKYGG